MSSYTARCWALLVRGNRRLGAAAVLALVFAGAFPSAAAAGVTQAEVERAIRDGVDFLRRTQQLDGSWPGQAGVTELAVLALLTAGEPVDGPCVSSALAYTSRLGPPELGGTYAVALQTMALAAANPAAYRLRIARNAEWLVETQVAGANRIFRGRRIVIADGSWSYGRGRAFSGDNSNTQYAALGLNAAAEAGIGIPDEVWASARQYWVECQQADGGWNYQPRPGASTYTMTAAGVSSLVITGLRQFQGHETLAGDRISHCGEGHADIPLRRGIDWLGSHFTVRTGGWNLYYLYGLERAGRLTGLRFFGKHDWYREGAEEIVRRQSPTGAWTEGGGPQVGTSFALLFLAKGRAPVLINKLRHGAGHDWDNDPDDVRNLVSLVSRDWGKLFTWQVVDPDSATVEDLLQAPIIFFNGHQAPAFSDEAAGKLRAYVEQGGVIFAEACCGRAEFDRGFRTLMKIVFPEPEFDLHELPEEHPIWGTRWPLSPSIHRLEAIEFGCRTAVVYSPGDLSCGWNQWENEPGNRLVIKSARVGQNVVDYLTGREPPADKLAARSLAASAVETPKRGALQIAKLSHGVGWNIAPMAIPRLCSALRDRQGFDVVINHRELHASDPNLIHFPLVYLHGRGELTFAPADLKALRRHLEPGGGTIFADAACGNPAFDTAFRKFIAELLPKHPLVPIPPGDALYTPKLGYDLSDVKRTKEAGGTVGLPTLEGVAIDGHWAVIYSKLDIGCALGTPQTIACKGYTHESALRIASNIVMYATLP
jgi:hypothetical protein